ncbi:amidohydrolase family protein [Xanthobacteraceae bacterium A53D]
MSDTRPRIALDVHAHLIPVEEGGLAAFDGVEWNAQTRAFAIDGHKVGLKGLFSARALLDWMDENGVARAFVSVPPPTYRPDLPEAETRRWADALNHGLKTIADAHADRLSALLHLPVEHPGLAHAIAGAAVADGHSRFAMSAGSAGVVLSDTAYAPLWSVLDAAGAFLFLHPGEGCDGRLDPFYLHNLLGNPAETALATAHLVFGGILERHPGLTVCLAHAGGTTAALAGRWERGHATARPGLDTGLESPRRTLRRLCVDCIGHDPAALTLAAEVFGRDRILFGSDWPFPMGLPRPHEQLADLDADFLREVLETNAQRIVGEA